MNYKLGAVSILFAGTALLMVLILRGVNVNPIASFCMGLVVGMAAISVLDKPQIGE